MFAVTLWFLLLCVGTNTVWTQEDESFFAIFEEEKTYWLRCYSLSISHIIGWQMKINNEYVNISTCDYLGNCTDYMAPDYVSNFNITENNYGDREYTIWVYIRRADKDENTFRCFIGSDPKPDRTVEIFARPSKPTCDLPVLVNSDTLSITCRTDKVYPGALLEAKMLLQVLDCPSDCPMNTYIVLDECKCELITWDYSPGQARWYTQAGKVVEVVGEENPDDRSSTLTLSYDHTDPTPTYECRAMTVLDVSSPLKVLYFTKFAYGPNSVSIETSDDGRSDLPSSEEPEELITNVTCKVPVGNVGPGVRVTITVNNDAVVVYQEAMIIGSYYVQDYSFSRSREGNYYITCKAENAASSELSVSNSTTLGLQENSGDGPHWYLIHFIVLPSAGAFLIIVFFVVIITVCIRRRTRTSALPENDNTDNDKASSDLQLDDYITPVVPDPDDYEKIIVNDDSTSEGGFSCINPTFDDSHQYDTLSEVITSMTVDNSWT